MYIHSLTHSCLSETESITTKATMLPESDEARLRPLNRARTRFSLMLALVAIMAAMNVSAQRIQVVDSDGLGIPLVTILTEDGNMIGTTNLDGVYENLKGASKVTLTHVAFKPQTVTVADLTDGRVTMEDNEYSLAEIVVKPKPYIYIEVFYRVYVYRNDSLCYFLSGIMPNTFDPQKNKLERGSYYLAYAEHCNKMSAAMNIRSMCLFLFVYLFSGHLPSRGITGSCSKSIFSFLRKLHTVLHSDCINLHSH